MGSLKDKITNSDKKYGLTDFELAYLQRTNVIKNELFTLQSAFLSYIAGTRFGYKEGAPLQFEVDFEKKEVTIKEMPDAKSN